MTLKEEEEEVVLDYICTCVFGWLIWTPNCHVLSSKISLLFEIVFWRNFFKLIL